MYWGKIHMSPTEYWEVLLLFVKPNSQPHWVYNLKKALMYKKDGARELNHFKLDSSESWLLFNFDTLVRTLY